MDGKIAALVATGLFDGWTAADLRKLGRAADLVDVGAGDYVVRRGVRRAGGYLIVSGAILTTSHDGSWLTSARGAFIGLAESLADASAQADSVAMRPSTLLVFTPASFAAAVDAIPPLRRAAVTELATARVEPRRPVANVAWATG